MKKFASLFLAILLTLAFSATAFAAGGTISPRYSNTQSANVDLAFGGNVISSRVVIVALSDNIPIRGTLKLTSGSYSQQWPISGTGDVDITKTVTRSQGGTYVLTFSGTCGSDPINKQTSGTK